MKFQNPSMHSSKPMHAQFKTFANHQNVCNVKMFKLTKVIIQEVLSRIY